MKIFLIFVLFCSINLHGQIITTIAGGGTSSSLGDGGPATAATIGYFGGICIDSHDNLYIADGNNYRIRKVNASSGIITTFAGTGTSGFSGDGGPATAAKINTAVWLSIDSLDNIYFNDASNYRIRKIDAQTGIITTYAGTGTSGFSGDGGPATAANIMGGSAFLDPLFGNLYFCDDHNYRIRKVNAAGIISTVCGNGTSGYSGDGGPASAALVNFQLSFATDSLGNLYFPDNNTNKIRKIDFTTGIISWFAGTGTSSPYLGDGITATASNLGMLGISMDDRGNLYMADDDNHRIEKIDNSGNVYSIAGVGISGFSGDNGPASAAKFYRPENVIIDHCGNILIADFGNKRVRKVIYPANPTISLTAPASISVGSSVTVNCSLYHAGYNYTIKWYNKGVYFNTTTTPSVTYTKTQCTDSITAVVYGCSDSAVSNLKVVRCNVGVASLVPSIGGMMCYPNPSRGEIIVSSDIERINSVVITNLFGAVVFRQSYDQLEQVKLNLDNLPVGIYLVKVNRVYVERVMKE